MTQTRLATARDLITALQNYNPDSPIRWVSTTLEYTTFMVHEVRVATARANRHDATATEVVWLCEGDETGHLPESVIDTLEW
ncbi:hypothetical protein C8D88_108113 [Lentzea atacamensis]|uniref:Uncharacterized protein n=1 Tax=Lentzea atacamensis TaxID=531938 RepID=A0A316HUY0_9PSEU|nr:hypothetical protein [Lentzea atacamensis]PWK84498.1 hypothetical protein C8D88_108113 [Lentzea atacamensis]